MIIMTEITIPFKNEMKQAILSGKKNCTSRTRKYGKVGDYFVIDTRKFALDNIAPMTLSEIAHMLYKREGFDSPGAFKDYWCKIHPIKKFDPHQKVYVHFFEELPDAVVS